MLFSSTDITLSFNFLPSAKRIPILETYPVFASQSIQTNIPL